jgi:hypothetical protein
VLCVRAQSRARRTEARIVSDHVYPQVFEYVGPGGEGTFYGVPDVGEGDKTRVLVVKLWIQGPQSLPPHPTWIVTPQRFAVYSERHSQRPLVTQHNGVRQCNKRGVYVQGQSTAHVWPDRSLRAKSPDKKVCRADALSIGHLRRHTPCLKRLHYSCHSLTFTQQYRSHQSRLTS